MASLFSGITSHLSVRGTGDLVYVGFFGSVGLVGLYKTFMVFKRLAEAGLIKAGIDTTKTGTKSHAFAQMIPEFFSSTFSTGFNEKIDRKRDVQKKDGDGKPIVKNGKPEMESKMVNEHVVLTGDLFKQAFTLFFIASLAFYLRDAVGRDTPPLMNKALEKISIFQLFSGKSFVADGINFVASKLGY